MSENDVYLKFTSIIKWHENIESGIEYLPAENLNISNKNEKMFFVNTNETFQVTKIGICFDICEIRSNFSAMWEYRVDDGHFAVFLVTLRNNTTCYKLQAKVFVSRSCKRWHRLAEDSGTNSKLTWWKKHWGVNLD